MVAVARRTKQEPKPEVSLATDGPMLPPAAAAEALGVTIDTLRVWRHEGRGPVWCKLGVEQQSRTVYPSRHLDAWFQANVSRIGGGDR